MYDFFINRYGVHVAPGIPAVSCFWKFIMPPVGMQSSTRRLVHMQFEFTI